MAYHAYGFVDGKCLRKEAERLNLNLVNPRFLCDAIVHLPQIQSWCATTTTSRNIALARILYYDARPDNESEASQDLRDYWNAIEVLDDTELGYGSIRGGTRRKEPRHKGVDTLIAVDMLVGAFTKLFPVALLVAGDADFVPVVNEVRRRGVMVIVAAVAGSLSEDLRRAADRSLYIDVSSGTGQYEPLTSNGRSWSPATAKERA